MYVNDSAMFLCALPTDPGSSAILTQWIWIEKSGSDISLLKCRFRETRLNPMYWLKLLIFRKWFNLQGQKIQNLIWIF